MTDTRMGSAKTQYQPSIVAQRMIEMGLENELQNGQQVPEDKPEFISQGYKHKRLFFKKNGKAKFSHGENLSYFNVMKQATRMRMLFVTQPLQVMEAISQFSIVKLRALIALANEELENKLSEQI